MPTTNPSLPGPAAAAPSAASRPGSLYRLGPHLLLCGDSTDPSSLERLFRSPGVSPAKADLLITDPPYNVDYKGAAGKIANDNKPGAAFLRFLSAAFFAA